MNDMIRIDPETLMWVSREFARLADHLDSLDAQLRRLQYHLPDCAPKQIFEDLAVLRRRLDAQGDKSAALARRVLVALDDFMRCERGLIACGEALETEMNYQFARLSRGKTASEIEN